MKCIKCRKVARVIFPNYAACSSCFCDIIEKRVRKEIRLQKLIEKNEKVLLVLTHSPESQVLRNLLESILKGMPLSITEMKIDWTLGKEIKGSYDKFIVPWSCDDEAEYFLSCILENKKPKFLGHYSLNKKKHVKLLLPVLHEEVILYAKLKALKSKDIKRDSIEHSILSSLQKDHSEIMFSVLKTSEEFRRKGSR